MAMLDDNVYLEVCKEGDIPCHNRNLRRLLDNLEKTVNEKIDDQSQGIAFGQKSLEQNIITNTNNTIAETQRFLNTSISAVYSKAADVQQEVQNLDDYVRYTQANKLHDIETGIAQVSADVSGSIGEVGTQLDEISRGIGQAQSEILDGMKTELNISGKMIQADIDQHDQNINSRFDNVTSQIQNVSSATANKVGAELDKQTNFLTKSARGMTDELNQVIGNAKSQIVEEIDTTEIERQEANWGLFEGIKDFVMGAFTFTPQQIVDMLLQFQKVAQLLGQQMNTQNKR